MASDPGTHRWDTSELRCLAVALMGTMCLLPLGGCATVNPRPDYQKATQHVTEATGQQEVYDPGADALVAVRVEALLAGGLTVDEAVQVCLLNNRAFQAAWMDVGMARAELVQSGLLSNPSLGGSLRLPAGGGLADLEVTMAQNIADLWQIPARKRTAQASLDQAIMGLARKAVDLAADTRAGYFRAVGVQQLHVVSQENLAIAQQLLELALNRQQAGAGSELDVNLSRSAVLEAELAVESARLAAAEGKRSLAKQLGLASDPEKLILLDSFGPSAPMGLVAERLIERARENRLDIRAAEQLVMQAEARLQEEQLKVFRTVELGVAMERAQRQHQRGRKILADTARASIANGQLTAPEIQPRSDRRTNTDFIIGPSWNMELPIFDQNQAQIAKAEYSYQQAAKGLESLERLMAQEVRSAVDQMNTAWKVARSYRDRFIPLAQRSLDLSRESYKSGRASFLSVLEAQRFYLDTRRRSIEATQAAAATIPEVERVVNIPLAGLREEEVGPPASGTAATQPTPGDRP